MKFREALTQHDLAGDLRDAAGWLRETEDVLYDLRRDARTALPDAVPTLHGLLVRARTLRDDLLSAAEGKRVIVSATTAALRRARAKAEREGKCIICRSRAARPALKTCAQCSAAATERRLERRFCTLPVTITPPCSAGSASTASGSR